MSVPPGQNRTPKTSRGPVQKSTAVIACHTCRSKKVKCSGTAPCQYCSKRGIDCSISPHGPRRVFSASKIAELQNQLATYRAQNHSLNNTNFNEATTPAPLDSASLANEDFPDEPALVERQENQRHTSNDTIISPVNSTTYPSLITTGVCDATQSNTLSTIPAESSLSSSNHFGRRVEEVLANSGCMNSRNSGTTTSNKTQVDDLHHSLRIGTQNPLTLPTEGEAFRLLDAASLFIGQSQTHYDLREISDRVGILYQNINDPVKPGELWYLQIILIFAVGKLYAAGLEQVGQSLPGKELFEFTERNFPPISVQFNSGRIGVEINAMMAMYLQMTNRKEEAHLYISGALRLALLHGYHHENTDKEVLRSHKAHLNRLWWTIYMQERRLAAATGTPSGIQDDAIYLSLPSDASGLPSAAAIRTNVKIARVTGRILNALYGARTKNQEEFVSSAQQIIKDLLSISTDIPPQHCLNLAHDDLFLRTTASLHLMLYQATLLTIRPLMLHTTQLVLSGSRLSSAELIGGTTGRLSKTCAEAARRIICTVIVLKERNLVALYGFAECDAIFSAVFIMLLTKIFDWSCEPCHRINPSPGLREAMDLLQFLADRGNPFARLRFNEVQSVYDHLSVILGAEFFETQVEASDHLQNPVENGDMEAQMFSDENGADTRQNSMFPGHEYQNSGASAWGGAPRIWPSNDFISYGLSMGDLVADVSLEGSFDQYQSLFNHPDWDLTGEDVADFAELRRHVLWTNSRFE